MPDGVTDRPADVWEPLLAIADAAGGDWPDRARKACVELVNAKRDTEPSLGVRLLADLRDLFDGAEALATEAILERLRGLDEAPWADIHGKPIDAGGLARRLSPYGVKSRNVRPEGSQAKGYERASFADAWDRYLPSPVSPSQASQASQAPKTSVRWGPTAGRIGPVGRITNVPESAAVPENGSIHAQWDAGTAGTDLREGDAATAGDSAVLAQLGPLGRAMYQTEMREPPAEGGTTATAERDVEVADL